MTIICGALILLLCTYLGYIFSRKYALKSDFYTSFNDFNEKIKNEVRFTQGSVLYVLKGYEGKTDDFFSIIRLRLNNKSVEKLKPKYLNDSEWRFLIAYCDEVGTGDRNSQIVFLESIDATVKNSLKKANEERVKYKNLCVKLGFLVGLMVFIIIL